eukprot:PhF_6_TR29876/c0_g1_i1/m.43825/K03015/RPB7, POLR2G; DNA-directed RNA polymerase II subunit RPB7
MFFKLNLITSISVPPVHFGAMIAESIKKIVCAKVEGHVDIDTGCFVIAVLDIVRTGPGKLQDYGDAVYVVQYQALAQKHFNMEVVDSVVASITPVGLNVKIAALKSYVRMNPAQWSYDTDTNSYLSTTDSSRINVGSVIPVRILESSAKGNTVKVISEMVQ